MDKIVTYNGLFKRRLRRKSRVTTAKEVAMYDLVNRLKAANDTAWIEGCGLAAIQIGIPIRFAWFKFNNREDTLLNPEITVKMGTKIENEACLSIPKVITPVWRSYEIEYISAGKKHTAKGMKARIIQHEIDHMDGILNIDKERAYGQKG